MQGKTGFNYVATPTLQTKGTFREDVPRPPNLTYPNLKIAKLDLT
jgi:hypothetical protein